MFVFLMIRRPPRSTLDLSSAASDVYKRQEQPSAIPADTTPVIEFSKDTLVFTAGCNNVAAGYFVQGEEIAVQPNVRLFVNCPGELGEAAMLLENTFDAALSSFDTFTLQGEELTIRYATGEMFLRRLSNVSSTTSGTVTPPVSYTHLTLPTSDLV